MVRYAVVQGGVIVSGPAPLPKNTTTVSGFDMQTDQELAVHGYYPVVGTPPATQPWESLAPAVLTIDEATKTVIQSWAIVPETLAAHKARRISDLKAVRDSDINGNYTNIMQKEDALGILDPTVKAAVVATVTTINDQFNTRSAAINAATTHAAVEAA